MNEVNKFERKAGGKGVVRAGKGFILFILNEDVDNIISIAKSLEDSEALIDGVTESVEHEIKEQEDRFLVVTLAPLAASVVESVISSVVKGITGRGVMTAGIGYYSNIVNIFTCAPSFK